MMYSVYRCLLAEDGWTIREYIVKSVKGKTYECIVDRGDTKVTEKFSLAYMETHTSSTESGAIKRVSEKLDGIAEEVINKELNRHLYKADLDVRKSESFFFLELRKVMDHIDKLNKFTASREK